MLPSGFKKEVVLPVLPAIPFVAEDVAVLAQEEDVTRLEGDRYPTAPDDRHADASAYGERVELGAASVVPHEFMRTCL